MSEIREDEPSGDQLLFGELLRFVGPGMTPLGSEIEIEKLYLRHQSLRRDIAFLAIQDELLSTDELSAEQQGQIESLIGDISSIAEVDEEILRARRDRLRILWVDRFVDEKDGKKHGLFLNQQGIAVVAKDVDDAHQNHYLLHEITHGLMSNGILFAVEDHFYVSGNGIDDPFTHQGDTLEEDICEILRMFNEAIIELFAFHASSIELEKYIEMKGYTDEFMAVVQDLNSGLLMRAIKSAFAEGLRDRNQAVEYAKAFDEAFEKTP